MSSFLPLALSPVSYWIKPREPLPHQLPHLYQLQRGANLCVYALPGSPSPWGKAAGGGHRMLCQHGQGRRGHAGVCAGLWREMGSAHHMAGVRTGRGNQGQVQVCNL